MRTLSAGRWSDLAHRPVPMMPRRSTEDFLSSTSCSMLVEFKVQVVVRPKTCNLGSFWAYFAFGQKLTSSLEVEAVLLTT